jgi:hypothetical protein
MPFPIDDKFFKELREIAKKTPPHPFPRKGDLSNEEMVEQVIKGLTPFKEK